MEEGAGDGEAPEGVGQANRIRFVEHRGERILLLDFSHLDDPGDAVAVIHRARDFVATHPRRSLLIITYVEGAKFNIEVAQAVWKLARANRPYVIAGAVVGLAPGLQQDLYHLVLRLSGRKLPAFDAMERAKEWLVEAKGAHDRGTPPSEG